MSDASIAFTIDKLHSWNSYHRRKWMVVASAITIVFGTGAVFIAQPWGSSSAWEATDHDHDDSNVAKLVVTSTAFETGTSIPKEFTGDGSSSSPPIEWSGVPEGTKSFALNVWHVPGPGGMKSYWVVYNIPADITKLDTNAKTTGTIGINDKNRKEYDPMKSKGPGMKQYHVTVYALSEELKLAPDKANRANLLSAMKGITLAEGTLDFQYKRGP